MKRSGLCYLPLLFLAPLAQSNEPDISQQFSLEDLLNLTVSIGTRAPSRTVVESPVPVDVFTSNDITTHGSTDINNVLASLAPSFNVSQQPNSDGSSFVRPFSLRGMAPDHTLILINGKRLHRAAVVHISQGSGSQARGTQGSDISNIPAIALKNTTILRDGAAAQYGSDAIAGVIDFSLRSDSDGVDLLAQYGQFYQGEREYKISTNIGLPLGNEGFFNFSAELTSAEELSRGTQHQDAITLINAEPSLQAIINDPAQIWGRPERNSFRTFWNSKISTENGDVYFFGNYAKVDATGGFFYRPITGVVAKIGRNDVFGTDNDGNCIQFCDLFPGGFAPRFSGDVTDLSQVVGYKADWKGVTYDFSYSYGSNKIDYTLRNTVNPALGDMGETTQTSFKPGALEQRDKNVNIDVTYPLDDLFLAAGFEWRQETYIVSPGERASWDGLPDIAGQGFSVGSNGFGGIRPEQAGKFDRDNIAIYVDAEWEPVDNFLLGAALRYEDFSDFGSTTNGKLTARYSFTPNFIVRSAISNGFKAPTVGQQVTSQITTQFVPDAQGNIQQSQVANLPVANPVAIIMGAAPLDAEQSVNFSFGGIYTQKDWAITADYYKINIDERIGLTTQITPDSEQQAQIDALDLPQNFSRIAYFANAFDTETQGIDIVVTHLLTDQTRMTLAYGWTETSVIRADERVVNRERRLELQEGLPQHKGSLTIQHNRESWNLITRLHYWGEILDANNAATNDERLGDEFTIDIEFSYQINQQYAVSLGASNLFDEYPDQTQLTTGPATSGLPYFRQSPFGYNGGLVYLRLAANF